MVVVACIFLLFQGLLQWSALELPMMAFTTLFVTPSLDEVADGRHLSVVINYNLLASNEADDDVTLQNAFHAYIMNLSPTLLVVMVSATGKQELKEYELKIRDKMRDNILELVLEEGKEWANGNVKDAGRASRCFEVYIDEATGMVCSDFLETILPYLACRYARDFMVVQRVTRLLKKCGQYQDLMLLREGSNEAWTYT